MKAAFKQSLSKYIVLKFSKDKFLGTMPPQPTFTCSKLTLETLEQGVEYVQS